MPADPYSVLGVSRDCSEDELKSAYRRLAKKYHPDLHPDDPAAAARMNEINAAYEQIKNGQANAGAYSNPYGNPYGSPYGAYGQSAYSYEPRWQQDAWQQSYQSRTYYRSWHPGSLLLRLLLAFLLFRLIGSLFFGAIFGGSSYSYSYSQPQQDGQYYYYYYYPGPTEPESAPDSSDTL